MTYVEIDIDIDDYLHRVPTRTLVAELQSRSDSDAPATTNRVLAQRLRGAFYRNDASQFEALLVAYLDPIEIKKPENEPA